MRRSCCCFDQSDSVAVVFADDVLLNNFNVDNGLQKIQTGSLMGTMKVRSSVAAILETPPPTNIPKNSSILPFATPQSLVNSYLDTLTSIPVITPPPATAATTAASGLLWFFLPLLVKGGSNSVGRIFQLRFNISMDGRIRQ